MSAPSLALFFALLFAAVLAEGFSPFFSLHGKLELEKNDWKNSLVSNPKSPKLCQKCVVNAMGTVLAFIDLIRHILKVKS